MSARVDLDGLAEAFADASAALEYYVDRETGEVLLVSDTLGFIEAGAQRFEMALQPGRYLPVPAATADDAAADLEAFIDGLADEGLAERLEEALSEPDPALAAERALAKHPAELAAFGSHRAARFRERAVRWAAEQGLGVEPG